MKRLALLLCLIAQAAFADQYSTVILADSPLWYWRMDAPSGTSETNLGSLGTGGGNNLTYVNTPSLNQTGIPALTDKAVYYDSGTSHEYGYMSGNPSAVTGCDSTHNCAWEAWIKLDTASGVYGLEEGGDQGGNNFNFNLIVGGTGLANFTIYTCAGANVVNAIGAITTATNNWGHYFVTWDHATTGVQICKDGQTDTSNTGSGTMCGLGDYINTGRRGDGLYAASGTWDEVAIYPSKLSGCTTAAAHYTAGTAVSATSWPFLTQAPQLPQFRNDGYFDKFVSAGYHTGLFAAKNRIPQYLTLGYVPFDIVPNGNVR